jgi:maltooligosyltrehalose trehalohydrolase
MTALLLLAPSTPLLFMGQEFAASAPFLYFADHAPELAKLVKAGRAEFLEQFRTIADPRMRDVLAPPHDRRTFEQCKLDFSEREKHADLYQLTKDLLKLRREDLTFQAQKQRGVDGAVLGEHAFVLRYFGDNGQDRLLVVNFGRDLHLLTCPEPLLAPPEGMRWRTVLSTDDPRYGGCGTPAAETATEGWRVLGDATVVLAPEPDPGGPVVMHHGRLSGGTKRIVY